MCTLAKNWSINEYLGYCSPIRRLLCCGYVFTTRCSCQHEWRSAFSLFSLVCVSPNEQSSLFCSRCEWLVAVGCREWARFLYSLCGWLGRSRVDSRHQCPGDLRPGSPYEALLKGQGGFWGNPAPLGLHVFVVVCFPLIPCGVFFICFCMCISCTCTQECSWVTAN